MKKIIASCSILVLGSIALVGCGDENTTEVTESVGMEIVQAGNPVPKCNQDNQGQMIYVADSSVAYVCIDGEWSELGADAASSNDGTDGADGKDGKAGSFCTAKILADSSGYKVLCDGDSVGVVLNGKDGADGKDGSFCSLKDNGDGTVVAICGEGDEADSTILYKGLCGNTPYDTTTQFCFSGRLFYRCGSYDPYSHFCDPRDSTLYRHVTIGSQVWMAENLNYAYVEPTADEDSSSFCYDGDPSYCETYGRLYFWSAAMDSVGKFSKSGRGCGNGATCSSSGNVRGVCPEGWHLPSKNESETLISFVGGPYAAAVKLYSSSGWDDEEKGTDNYGFSILPAGRRNNPKEAGSNGALPLYSGLGSVFLSWTSTENDEDYVFEFGGNYVKNRAYLSVSAVDKIRAFSVRCLRD